MKFSQHISSKINKSNSILGLIGRSFSYLDRYSFAKIYTALVRLHLEHGNTIWYPHLRKDIESIEKVQMRATRILSEIKHLNYEERLKTLNLPTLAHRRHRGDMIQTFKIIKGLKDIPVERFFTIVNSNTRGHMCKLVNPRCNTPFRLQHFSQRIINDWNELSTNVIWAKTVDEFKILLDCHWDREMYLF